MSLFLNPKRIALTGKYHESLNDAKSATELQPTFLKAIVRGKPFINELYVPCSRFDSEDIYRIRY